MTLPELRAAHVQMTIASLVATVILEPMGESLVPLFVDAAQSLGVPLSTPLYRLMPAS